MITQTSSKLQSTTSTKIKSTSYQLIDRANSLMFLAGCLWVAIIVPQTPPEVKLTFAFTSGFAMHYSGKALDEAKDNPQRRIYEESMKNL